MLTVRGLSKTYATADGNFHALKGVDFEIPDGGGITRRHFESQVTLFVPNRHVSCLARRR